MVVAILAYPLPLIRKDLISMDIYTIYRITNLVNNKIYIGWTSRDPHIRYKEHQKKHQPKNQARSPLSYAIEKYGVDNFLFEVIYQSRDYAHARDIETYFVIENNSMLDGWGYNVDKGGTGHKRSKDTIEKHRKRLLGRKQSEEHKRNKANAIRGEKNGMYNIGNKHPMKGKHHSDETKKKMRETVLNKNKKREAEASPLSTYLT